MPCLSCRFGLTKLVVTYICYLLVLLHSGHASTETDGIKPFRMWLNCGHHLTIRRGSRPVLLVYDQDGRTRTGWPPHNVSCRIHIRNENQPFSKLGLQFKEYNNRDGFSISLQEAERSWTGNYYADAKSVPYFNFTGRKPPSMTYYTLRANPKGYFLTISGSSKGLSHPNVKVLVWTFHEGTCYDLPCDNGWCLQQRDACLVDFCRTAADCPPKQTTAAIIAIVLGVFTAVAMLYDITCRPWVYRRDMFIDEPWPEYPNVELTNGPSGTPVIPSAPTESGPESYNKGSEPVWSPPDVIPVCQPPSYEDVMCQPTTYTDKRPS